MSDEKAERPVIKCQGQVTLARLPNPNENPERGRISTLALSTLGRSSPVGYLYLRQREGYRLGFVFEVEITLRRIPEEEFYAQRGLKPRPETAGVKPV